MPKSQYRDRQLRAKTREVKAYHYNAAMPGKPLHLLVPGGLIALACLCVEILIIYRTWYTKSLDTESGTQMVLLVAPFYIGGVFLFSYGYELYDVPRALRLTAIIVFCTVAALVIVAVLCVLLRTDKPSSSNSESGSKSPSSSGDKSSGGGGAPRRSSVAGSSPIFLGGGGETVTREVVGKEPVKPSEPRPVPCGHCGQAYVPKEVKYACPSCGASTTATQIDESEGAGHWGA